MRFGCIIETNAFYNVTYQLSQMNECVNAWMKGDVGDGDADQTPTPPHTHIAAFAIAEVVGRVYITINLQYYIERAFPSVGLGHSPTV